MAGVLAWEFLRAHAGEVVLELVAVRLLAFAGGEEALAGVGEVVGVALEVFGRGSIGYAPAGGGVLTRAPGSRSRLGGVRRRRSAPRAASADRR